jgi:hypothetical protein
MENREKIENLHSLFEDVSKKLSKELLKSPPDILTVKECRRQLLQLDRDIRRIQMRKDWE